VLAAIWILMWMFIFILAVELFGRRYYALCPPVSADRSWLAVNLSDDMNIARGQFEYYLSWIEWNGANHRIVFVHDESISEISSMFGRYFDGLPNVKLTAKSKLGQMLGE